MKRISILVNKDFEYAGFIEGLRDTVQVYGGTNGRDAECRFDNLIADIYCIQNLFGRYKYGKYDSPDNASENSSNSEMKYGYLSDLFGSQSFRLDECDGILSLSTSESTPDSQGEASVNGNVYVGNRFFLSDQRVNDVKTRSHLEIGFRETDYTEFYIEKPIYDSLYEFLNITDMNLRHVKNSPSEPQCMASDFFSCVGVVNVMDCSCYGKADECAYDMCQQYILKLGQLIEPVGIETTHGVVVKALKEACGEIGKDIPVNFISPIVDRYLSFDEDVDGKYGKQNFTCSYNGGVVAGHMLRILNENWK